MLPQKRRRGEATMGAVVNCAAYESGCRIADIALEETGAMLCEGRFLWIGLHEPDEDVLQCAQQQFGLHDLAIEDAHAAHQRPKLEIYGDALFLVLRTAQLQEGKIQWGETHVFAGKGYVLSVRHGASHSYAEVRARCERTPRLLAKGESFVLYSIMDFVVDNYMPIIDAIEAEIDEIEDRIFTGPAEAKHIERVYVLRRDLLAMRRTVSPLLDVCNRLMRSGIPLIDPEMYPYFRDVQDHAIRVTETIDNLRELLTSIFEASVMLGSTRQNEVMKKLTGWAAILAVPTAITGIYGMNFEFMPELKWQYGYFVVIVTIVGLCSYLWLRFRRVGWL
jgi:magnesium transporter